MMNTDPVIANQSSEQLAENRAENRDELIREFVGQILITTVSNLPGSGPGQALPGHST